MHALRRSARVLVVLALCAASARGFDAKTARPATGEILKEGKVIGTLVIPPDTPLQAQRDTDETILVNYRGLIVRIKNSDTNLRPMPTPVPPDFEQLRTKLGEVYDKVYIVERNPAEISIKHTNGRSTLRIEELDSATEQALGYDPNAASNFLERRENETARKAEVQERMKLLEAERIAKRKEAAAAAKAASSAAAQPSSSPSAKPADEGGVMADKLWNALVARVPAKLFALTIDAKNISDPKSTDYGKGARPGAAIAEIPPGFFVIATRNCDVAGGAVELPAPIGEHRFAYVYRTDFAHIGAAGWRKWWDERAVDTSVVPEFASPRATEFSINPRTELRDIFAKGSVVVSNKTGALTRVWELTDARRSERPGLGLARTQSGFFFGYFAQKQATPAVTLDWRQVVKSSECPFTVRLEKTAEIKKGSALFKLADFTGTRREVTPRTDPRQVRVLPEHYGTLLHFGLPGVLAEIEVPLTDAVKVLPATASGTQPAEKQVIVKELAVKFVAWSRERTLLDITAAQEERQIERTEASGGESTVKVSPWKKAKLSAEQWIENDPDGGLRLTDGNRILEVSASGMFEKLELRTYTAVPNALLR